MPEWKSTTYAPGNGTASACDLHGERWEGNGGRETGVVATLPHNRFSQFWARDRVQSIPFFYTRVEWKEKGLILKWDLGGTECN